ncbi:MAG: coproporphyrinogen III oxidase family protein [Caldiserica bacterium]|nr:MAG: coproporphyrinogen III oxidase family protein [Caldisericota bacterium]
MIVKNRGISIYIHIPFCLKKCNYCDFVSFNFKKDEVRKYVEYLNREIFFFSKKNDLSDLPVSTVYFGGGTPSLLTVNDVESILLTVQRNFKLLSSAEITLEANPESIEAKKFKEFRTLGINRISMGAQSFNDTTLNLLGRIHDADEIYKSFASLKAAGINNINIDIMFALPGETIKDLMHSLKKAVNLDAEHISFYSLLIERGTLFYRKRKVLHFPGSDEEAEQYRMGIDFLESSGYKHYEISNFSKDNFQCKHNVTYWKNLPYLGFGVAAGSYYKRKRTRNVLKLDNYYKKLNDNTLPIGLYEHLKGKKAKGEHIMMNLRLLEGCDKYLYYTRFGSFPVNDFVGEIEFLSLNGLIEEDERYIRLTKRGVFLANIVFEQFITL